MKTRNETVGERITLARKHTKTKTCREFAALADVKWDDLSRWERRGVVPRAATLTKIAEAAGVRLEWLITGEGPMVERRGRR
jgi:transcriptional regulator with XRE-family HTH domain